MLYTIVVEGIISGVNGAIFRRFASNPQLLMETAKTAAVYGAARTAIGAAVYSAAVGATGLTGAVLDAKQNPHGGGPGGFIAGGVLGAIIGVPVAITAALVGGRKIAARILVQAPLAWSTVAAIEGLRCAEALIFRK